MRKSALLQTFEHWFRIIQHRLRNKEIACRDQVADDTDDMAIEEAVSARRERSLASSAQAHWESWKSNCTRVGSRWVLNESREVANMNSNHVNVENEET